jgi:hypothetical protein
MSRGLNQSYRIWVAAAAMVGTLAVACGGGGAGAGETAPPAAAFAVTLSRSSVRSGAPIDVSYTFTPTPSGAFDESYWVMVHFVGADGDLLWVDDHKPPTPTSTWKSGQPVQYTRTLFVPGSLPPGDVSVIVGLYSPDTQRRLPLDGQETESRGYRGATFHVEPADVLEFTEGWYDHEGQTRDPVRWRWTKRQATARLPNPGGSATLYLEVAATEQFPSAPRVTVSIGGRTVDEFDAPLEGRVLRRIAVPTEVLGAAPTVDAVIAVDRTFSPAALSGGSSADTRQLGVRVFNLAIQSDR